MTQKFTIPCFIRKNTAELKRKLEELGYCEHHDMFNTCNFLHCCKGMFSDRNFSSEKEFKQAIDCGDNESLFIALAALRSDCNIYQWFTNGIDWYLNRKEEVCIPSNEVQSWASFHKATVQEILEHFKE